MLEEKRLLLLDVIDDPATFHQDIIKYRKISVKKTILDTLLAAPSSTIHSKTDICFLDQTSLAPRHHS